MIIVRPTFQCGRGREFCRCCLGTRLYGRRASGRVLVAWRGREFYHIAIRCSKTESCVLRHSYVAQSSVRDCGEETRLVSRRPTGQRL